MNQEPVVLINPFIVPPGSEDGAILMWEKGRDFLSTQPGYISTELHRALSSDATYTLINVAKWESAETFRAAITAMRQNSNLRRVEGVTGGPALYRVIRT